ncbi:MAG: tetratricopeptide repeat protein [Candidatus Thorarchaeota archaeon]
MENSTPSKGGMSRPKKVAIIGVLIIIFGIVLALLVGWGIVPLPLAPGDILGFTILIGAALICCTSTMFTSSIAAKMPGYGDMEIKFRQANQLFDEEEYEQALALFKELMGPEMNHKRALYYAARCCEKLDDYEGVKVYCNYYIKMQPRDAEVWEMLSNAHKKLFEYEEAEDAMIRAEKFK